MNYLKLTDLQCDLFLLLELTPKNGYELYYIPSDDFRSYTKTNKLDWADL